MTVLDVDSLSISCSFSSVEIDSRKSEEWRVNSIEVENFDPIYQPKWTSLLIFSELELTFNSEKNLHLLRGNGDNGLIPSINISQSENVNHESVNDNRAGSMTNTNDCDINVPLNRILKGVHVSNMFCSFICGKFVMN